MSDFRSKKSQVSEEAKLCRQGEGFFLSLLSKYSILHKVEGGSDIGIDYFCEWLNQGRSESTNALFAVQLKTTRRDKIELKSVGKDNGRSNLKLYEIKRKDKKGRSKGNFDNSLKLRTIEYWRGFEIPIYLFVAVLNEKEIDKLFYKRYTPILHRTDKKESLKFHLVSNRNVFLAFADNSSKEGGFCRDFYIDYIRCNYKKGAIFYRNPREFGLNQFLENRFFFDDMATNEYKIQTKDMFKWVDKIKEVLIEKHGWQL